MNLFTQFQQFISKEGLFNSSNRLLLAVSGGVDSIVLCELCRRAGFDFTIAHCNFQLRGEESERDEQFVKLFADRHGIPLLIKKFDTIKYAEEHKTSIQIAARELRYEWFNEIESINFILTAHHADDNMETVLMNFFKGTGISGLHGILPKHGKLVRPLLFASKKDILDFSNENGLQYVEDSSNSADKYTRNYFRNQLIPALEKVYPAVRENMQNSIQRFREVEVLYQQSIDLHRKKLLEYKGDEIHIPVLKLMKAKPVETILYEIVKDFGFTSHQVPEVLQLAESTTGKYVASATHRIIKNRNWLIISSVKPLESAHFVIEENDKMISFDRKSLKFEKTKGDQPISVSSQIAQLDAEKITYPLLLRKWKTGDYFYPLGMKKKKKLSRFFIDQKLSLTDKENTWVLEMDKKIVWVAGLRIDDRFKLTPTTNQVLTISLESL